MRLLLCAISLMAGAWGLAVYAGSGISTSLAGVRISSNDPLRPLLVAAAAAVAYVVVSGAETLRRDTARLRAFATPIAFAAILAGVAAGTALRFNAWTAGGSDAYSYVTQADLWLAHDLRIPMPLAQHAPWPDAIATFTPFGYREAPDRQAIVPVTAPGLPLMMAAFKAVAGHAAAFFVVPLTGALLICATFAIGRRMGSDAIGLASAWLIATSPTVLVMSKSVMSDVPAAAFWALAVSLLLSRSTSGAFGAGVSAAVAILIRPNLLPVAVVLGVWSIAREIGAGPDRRVVRVLAYAAGVIPGCAAVAAVNWWLYGSPSASGYGDLQGLFSVANVAVNLRQYSEWLAETQTPLALIGVAALLVPSRSLWPTGESQRGARLLALVVFAVFGSYAAYKPFDAWWYLRFVLPLFPCVCIGTAALILSPTRGRSVWLRGTSAAAVIALGFHGISTAIRLGAYPPGEGERRYATIAELVARVTDPSGVIITTSHAGPMRYYGGRMTVRYDLLDAAWLDRGVEWLERQGHHPYILLEASEIPEFTQRFSDRNSLGRLDMIPVFAYQAYGIGGTVYLFDPLTPRGTTWKPAPIHDPRPRCPVPAVRHP